MKVRLGDWQGDGPESCPSAQRGGCMCTGRCYRKRSWPDVADTGLRPTPTPIDPGALNAIRRDPMDRIADALERLSAALARLADKL